jgi:hypothetical protein
MMKPWNKHVGFAVVLLLMMSLMMSILIQHPAVSIAQSEEGDYSDSPDDPVIFFPITGPCLIGESVSVETEALIPDGDADDGVSADGVTLTVGSIQSGCTLMVLIDGQQVFETTQTVVGTVTYAIPEVSAAFGTSWIRAIATEIGNPRSGEVEDWGPTGGAAPPESPPGDLCAFVADLVEAEAKKIQENGGTVANAVWAVMFSPLNGMPAGQAIADYLNTFDPNDPITDDMIGELGDLVRNNWNWNPPEEVIDPPKEDPRECGGFVSPRDFCLEPPTSAEFTTEESGEYETIRYGAGQIFVQEIVDIEGIGPELDCELYSEWFSDTYGGGTLYTFVPGLVDLVPVCRTVIRGDGFNQHEMAFWNPIAERAYGLSVFAEDLPTFVETNQFLFDSNFRIFDSAQ